MKHIKKALPSAFDQNQFAYLENRSAEDAIATVLRILLEHLKHKNIYAKLLFIDFSSTFNTIRPNTLLQKLCNVGLNNSLCNWILDFLTNRSQCVETGEHISNTIYINTGAPQGCVLSPLLYTLYTHDCSASFPTNHIIKFATTVLGLVTNNNEMAYREETELLAGWCKKHNLTLNIIKTKEIILDFRKSNHPGHSALYINREAVERVNSFKCLGLTVSEDLSWGNNITLAVGKAQQRLFFLRKLKRAKLPHKFMISFYNCAIHSVLTYGLLVSFSSCTVAEQQMIQRVVKTAGKIIETVLPEVSTVSTSCCLRRTRNIIKDRFHPTHSLFHLLPSGRRYRSLQARTTRMAKSLYPQAVRLLNKHCSPLPTTFT
uniref:Reverse transcriptase domain-containing protein n=1 Tax=Cyprinus carpio TaxID=7962 RepID=A0A8C1WEF3_CYPCA